jgi:hypothetical protein
MRGGGEGRAGSGSGIGGSERRDSAGVEMPDSFAELQRREGCIAVTDSWERMAGVACRDCEVSGFLFLLFLVYVVFSFPCPFAAVVFASFNPSLAIPVVSLGRGES